MLRLLESWSSIPVLRLLESWSSIPAFVLGRRMDVLAYNAPAGLLHGDFATERNIVRVVFLHPSARETYPDWDAVAQETVATLRAAAGADLDDPGLTELVRELSLKGDEFRRLWARHDVREKASGTKRLVHPLLETMAAEQAVAPVVTAA